MFAQSLKEQEATPEQVDAEMSRAIHIVERELGVCVDEDYLLVKFFNQLEEINWYREQEKKEYDRVK